MARCAGAGSSGYVRQRKALDRLRLRLRLKLDAERVVVTIDALTTEIRAAQELEAATARRRLAGAPGGGAATQRAPARPGPCR